MEIRPFRSADLDAAAGLFVERYAEQRGSVPALPAAWEEPARVARLLERLVAAGPALVAADGSRLLGCIGGWIVDAGEEPWIYVPEWAHGARGERRRTWEELYAAVLPQWLARGARVHRVSVLADDHELAAALDWLSFGTTTVDALRGADVARRTGAAEAGRCPVRRATAVDTDAVVRLREGLRHHLQTTPVYLVLPRPIDVAAERAKLEDPAVATFLADVDGEVAAFLRIGPSAEGVATIVRDPRTASITGAFTVAGRRGAGIGSCLLDEALAWARSEGYARVAVDFEPMNLLAARFWTPRFRAVVFTKTRSIDPHAVAAEEERAHGPGPRRSASRRRIAAP